MQTNPADLKHKLLYTKYRSQNRLRFSKCNLHLKKRFQSREDNEPKAAADFMQVCDFERELQDLIFMRFN